MIRLLNPGATRPHQLLHLVCGFRWDNVKAGTIRILTNRGSLPIGPHQKSYLGVAGDFKGLKAGKRQNALTTEGHGGKRQASRLYNNKCLSPECLVEAAAGDFKGLKAGKRQA